MTNTKFKSRRHACQPKTRGVQFANAPINSILDELFNGDLFGSEFKKVKKTVFDSLGTYPATNIKETETDFHLELIVPGFEKNSFEIDLKADQLTVKSKKAKKAVDNKANAVADESNQADESLKNTKNKQNIAEIKENNAKVAYLRKEFVKQHFNKTFTLPENVNIEGISANYKSGILHIVLPKQEATPKVTRTIDVS